MTRIIGGVLGSLRLKGPAKATRPTSDRVKESIFSILESRGAIEDARVLDLYAGTGALGLEAASRGARSVTFVERDSIAADVCKENIRRVQVGLNKTRMSCDLSLQKADALRWMPQAQFFDLIFADPPYSASYEKLSEITSKVKLGEGGLLVLECSSLTAADNYSDYLSLVEQRRYGDTTVMFLSPKIMSS